MKSIYRVVKALCHYTDTPRSLTVWLLYQAEEWEQLFSLTVDPMHYSDSEQYYRDASVTDFLRKVEYPVPGRDLEREAREAFSRIEAGNKSTNMRLQRFVDQFPLEGSADLRILEFSSLVRRTTAWVLGPLMPAICPRFGPGATYGDKGRLTTIPDKITNRATLTDSVSDLLPFWWDSGWGRAVQSEQLYASPEVVRGNRFTTVPKDGLKRRGICIEPSINVGFQLDVGKGIRSRLLRSMGIDLNDGQQIHRDLARRASVTGDLATIDLSNASDTLTLNAVRLLLPTRWCELLEALRSPFTSVNGKWVKLEKFSSMGNGFTFELETLVFASVCWALAIERGVDLHVGQNFGVYGDDIIIPTVLFDDVVAALKFYGFSPNPKKTFGSGWFRESCGGDFFRGVAVRPYFLKEIPSEPQHYFTLLNGLRRSWRQASDFPDRKVLFSRVRSRVLDSIPRALLRVRGPDSLGDLVINEDGNWWTRANPGDPQQRQVRVYAPVSRGIGMKHWKPAVILAAALSGISSDGPTPRGSVSGYRLSWAPCLEEPLFG